MGRPKKISDEALLEGTRKCLLKNGANVSTTVIADCVGVSQAVLFKRFATKEDLVIAALAPPEHPAWFAVLESGPDEGDFYPQFAQVVRLLHSHMENVFPRITLLRASGIDPHRLMENVDIPPPARLVKLLVAWFGRAYKNGQIRAVNVNALALALVGAAHGQPFLKHVAAGHIQPVASRTYIRTLVDVLWSGIRPGGPE